MIEAERAKGKKYKKEEMYIGIEEDIDIEKPHGHGKKENKRKR